MTPARKWYFKRELNEKQKARCHYCLRAFKISQLTFDHIVPKSKGGTNQEDNFVLACLSCNELKGRLFLPDFLWLVRKVTEVNIQRQLTERDA